MLYDKAAQATEEFARWSKSYDRSILQVLLFQPSHRALIRRIRAVAGDRPARLLDVGCGTGVFAERIREALPRVKVWGVDLVPDMLARGSERWRRHLGSVQPVQGEGDRLPFADSTFDFVTCSNSFHHYPSQEQAVCEMHRVLRPGGRLMIIDGYRDGPWGWFIYDVCVTGVEGAVHHASARQFRDLFATAGLRAVAQRVFRGLAPFLLTEAIAAEHVSAIPSPHFHAFAEPRLRDARHSRVADAFGIVIDIETPAVRRADRYFAKRRRRTTRTAAANVAANAYVPGLGTDT